MIDNHMVVSLTRDVTEHCTQTIRMVHFIPKGNTVSINHGLPLIVLHH